MTIVRPFVARLPGLIALSAAVAATSLILIYAVSYAVFGADTTPLRSEITAAFSSGALLRDPSDTPNRRIGSLTYNDCLILTMAANTTQPRLLKTVTPAAIELPDNKAIASNTCEMLYEYIVENRTAEFRSWPYHRYIDAFVAPVAALVPALGVAGTRNLLKAINYAACAAIGIASALLLYRRRERGVAADPRLVAGCIVSLTLLGFFGMEFYSQNLSIGLAEPVVFALMAAFIFGDPLRWRRWRFALVTSIVFALITALEFWTGQIPFATAAGLGLLGLGISSRPDIEIAVSRGLDYLAVAGTTVFAMFGLKIAIASVVFGDNVLANFLGQLEIRVADGNFSLLDLVLHMAGRADHIGQGSLVLGLASGLAAMLALATGVLRLYGPGSPPARTPCSPGRARRSCCSRSQSFSRGTCCSGTTRPSIPNS